MIEMKTIRKIMCCCGSGLGSSLIMEMNLDKVLKDLQHMEVQVEHASIAECNEYMSDLFVIGSDLAPMFVNYPRVVIIDNLISKEELKEKMKKAFMCKKDVYCIR